VIEKPAAAPGVLETIASRDPEESLTTEAVTPRLDPLIAVAKLLRVSPAVPVPVGMVAVAPEFVVIVKEEVGRVEVGLASRSEYHDPALARLLTTTVCTPATVPVAAVAVRALMLEEVTVRAAKGPLRVFSDCMSDSTADVAV
jgi:hypothetical protein